MGRLALFILVLNTSFAFAQTQHTTPATEAHVRQVLESLEVAPHGHQEAGAVPALSMSRPRIETAISKLA